MYTMITMKTEVAKFAVKFLRNDFLACSLVGSSDLLFEVVDISQGGSLLLDTNPRLARDSLIVRSSISSGACFLCNRLLFAYSSISMGTFASITRLIL